jgi:hypothetical protein
MAIKANVFCRGVVLRNEAAIFPVSKSQTINPAVSPIDGKRSTITLGDIERVAGSTTAETLGVNLQESSSIDANDRLLGRFIRFSILGNFPLNLFVDALPNRVDPASGSGMGSSAHPWEEHSQHSSSLAIRNLRSQAHLQMTQLGRHSPREDFRNRAPNLCAGAALTTSISRSPEAYGPQDGVQTSAAEVFDRPLPTTSETFPPLFTMLVQLLLYHGVLQPIRNLLRFLQIDSKVFRNRTPGDPFDGAQRNRGSFTIFSDALHYDVPAHVSSWLVSRASEP